MFVNDVKTRVNMMIKKRYQNYNLLGHSNMITALDVKGSLIASGSKDATVRVWDIDRKKAFNFYARHSLTVSQVKIWDENNIVSAGIDHSIRSF